IGPFLGLTIIQYTSFNMLFIITSFFSLFAVISGFIPSLPKKQDEQQRDASTSSRDKKWLEFEDLFERRALPVSFMAGILLFTYASLLSFSSIYVNKVKMI